MVSLHIETARFKWVGHKNELYFLRNTLVGSGWWAPFYIHGYSGYWDLGDISTVMTKPHSDTILPEGLFGSFRILDIFGMSMDIY